jgi:hypothetical protein
MLHGRVYRTRVRRARIGAADPLDVRRAHQTCFVDPRTSVIDSRRRLCRTPRNPVRVMLVSVARRPQHQLGLDYRRSSPPGRITYHLSHEVVAMLALQLKQHLPGSAESATASPGGRHPLRQRARSRGQSCRHPLTGIRDGEIEPARGHFIFLPLASPAAEAVRRGNPHH